MYWLVILTCTVHGCEHLEIEGKFRTRSACLEEIQHIRLKRNEEAFCVGDERVLII